MKPPGNRSSAAISFSNPERPKLVLTSYWVLTPLWIQLLITYQLKVPLLSVHHPFWPTQCKSHNTQQLIQDEHLFTQTMRSLKISIKPSPEQNLNSYFLMLETNRKHNHNTIFVDFVQTLCTMKLVHFKTQFNSLNISCFHRLFPVFLSQSTNIQFPKSTIFYGRSLQT